MFSAENGGWGEDMGRGGIKGNRHVEMKMGTHMHTHTHI